MDEPATPSLRAEPILLVATTYPLAQRAANNLGLRVREWRHVTGPEHIRGMRHARYYVCPWVEKWPRGLYEVVERMKHPAYNFTCLTESRVKNLVLRDRAAEQDGMV